MTATMKRMLAAGAALAVTPFASATLLVDAGFESNPLTSAGNVLSDFPTYQGQWGAEAATIVGPEGNVTPWEGNQMMRMVDDGLVATQAFQVTDVTSYAGLIDSGNASVNLSMLLNVDTGVPSALGGVTVLFFSASNFGSQIGASPTNNITLDTIPQTWEPASVSAPIPVNTRWLLTQVAYSNVTLGGHPGYVDFGRLDIVPEPATALLLAAGSLGLLVRRR